MRISDWSSDVCSSDLQTADYRPVANIENRLPGAPGSALNHDTIGIIARASDGHVAAACTTSGMAFKMRGRVGDSPQAGCGLFVERGVGAAVSPGVGAEVIRTAGPGRVTASRRGGPGGRRGGKEGGSTG